MESIPLNSTKTFWDLRAGMCARVVKACSDCPHGLRMQELGLTQGVEFKVTKVAPLGDPIEILVRGVRLCVRRKEMLDFEIEILE